MLLNLGQPIQMLVEITVIIERTPDFYEMLLHHIVHVALVFTLMAGSLSNCGVIGIFLHSFSDIFLQASKTLNLLGHMRGPGFAVIALSHVSWVYMRLVCFPLMTLRKNESATMNLRPDFAFLSTFLAWSDAFLSCLYAMHCYWYFLICKITYRAVMKGVVKDIHNDVTAGIAKDKTAKAD